MMEAVRSLGLAARFVTGYLHVPEGRRGERTGFRTRNRGLQIELTRYSNPSSELRASRRALFLSKCFERVTDKIMAISERNVRMPLRAVMVVGRVAPL